ncbi:NFX1-type zinc finger-containing protein 1 [Desmophyllum pertusum]|uniref:NFX1-type zinc finger-containing protein 1 n=1 Tax=Desmophyllum pertusum TaxID=174260 RepID=A0A9W9YCF1_9CNID|nr:NFX1-type zinc finger-containing protein 1 [Desmophyllum pertusum]
MEKTMYRSDRGGGYGGRGGPRGGGRGWGRGGARGGGGGSRGGGRGGGRGGRGGDGPPENQRQVRLGFKALQDLETKTPDEIILDMTSSRCFPATESLLTQPVMRDDWIVLIVSVLTKACDCSSKEYLFKLLNLLPSSLFLNLHLRSYLNRLSASRMTPSDITVFLKNVVKLMNELLRRFPNSYAELPVSDLYCGTRMLSDTGQLTDDALVTEVDELMKLRSEKADELKRKEQEKQQRTRPRRDAGVNDDVNPPNDFRELSVIPTQADILSGERPFLRRNKIDGSYHDAEHYLDVQFRLLREDFVRPLREGIAKLLERIGSATIGALQDIRVYKDVSLLYPVCTSSGLRYRIKFDSTKLKHIRWENSKRLIYGSLMCLSKDKFDSFVFATVANRDLKELKQGTVDIQFIQLSDNVRLEAGDVYQMVESTSYFEAYRHVLEGLKEVESEKLPLQNYIVNCQKQVEPPAYLRNRLRGRVTFDLTPIMSKESRNSTAREMRLRLAGLSVRDNARKGTDVSLLNLASWPSAEDLGLDDSQFGALQMALTKEFVVIQGPPGTGKTYIGLKIANVLLHNKMKWDTGTELIDHDRDDAPPVSERRPILIVCYTNHALDQFLEGIHEFHPEGIVRVGGRSQSEVMKACSLSELKHQMHKDKSVPLHIRRAFYDAHQEMDHITTKLQGAAEDLKKCLENVLHEDDLNNRAPSMTADHYESLKQVLVGSVGHKENAILHWLQLSINSANDNQVQPVAVFPLNKHCGGLERVSRAKLATLSLITWADENDGNTMAPYSSKEHLTHSWKFPTIPEVTSIPGRQSRS